MPNGVKSGERRGGRKRGTPNKATRERALLAQRILEEQQGKTGRKLAREVLDDFMHLFTGMAAVHQPLPDGVVPMNGQKPNPDKFLEFAKLAIDTAAVLAPFQSPKLKAVMVSQETPPGGVSIEFSQGSVPSKFTPQQAYRMLRDNDIVDYSSEAQMIGGKRIFRGSPPEEG